MISRVWGAFGLQPYQAETFKLSTDLAFVNKIRDVVGLYLAPPHRAVVLCGAEKLQIQPTTRIFLVLPLRLSQPERRAHDYRRASTTELFAAVDVQAGRVIGRCAGSTATLNSSPSSIRSRPMCRTISTCIWCSTRR